MVTREAGTVRVEGSPFRVVLPAGRTTTSPTEAPKSRLKPALRAAEKTSEPTTNATPRAIAKVLIINRGKIAAYDSLSAIAGAGGLLARFDELTSV